MIAHRLDIGRSDRMVHHIEESSPLGKTNQSIKITVTKLYSYNDLQTIVTTLYLYNDHQTTVTLLYFNNDLKLTVTTLCSYNDPKETMIHSSD